LRKPITGIVGCCARAESGHAAAAPPMSVMTSRRHPSFRDWAVGEFDTLTGPVKGANATAEVLLPIAAVAVGMTVLGLVFHIIASGAG
jgi:hypothetical protein